MTDQDLIRRELVASAIQFHVTDDDDRYTVSRAIGALPAVQPVAKVRALEWTERSDGLQWYGHSPKGLHLSYTVLPEVREDPEGPWVSFLDDLWRKFPSIESAKSAAQADYEARIMSALDMQAAPDLTANAALAAQLAEACARADRYEVQVTAMSEELEAAYREIEAMRKGGCGMTPAEIAAKLTEKRAFCLREISKTTSTWDICKAAQSAGMNAVRYPYEWADAPVRDLRNMGLAVKTGTKDRMSRALHAITPFGRAVLAELEKEKRNA